MKAAVCHEFAKPLVIEDVVLAPPGPGEVRVNIAACAICYSDITYMRGGWGGTLPAVYGHEAAGVVEEIGTGVTGVAPGDHAVVTLIRSCGHCYCCAQGVPVACESSFSLDEPGPLTLPTGERVVQGLRTGAFADEVVVHGSQVVAIDKDVSFEAASLLGCGVITGFGAVSNAARLRVGSTAVVIGAGGVGLNSIQGASIGGARTVIAVDIVDSKRKAAMKFGATHAVDGRANDLTDQIFALTDGRGADYVFVTVGAKSAIEQGFDLVAPAGAIVLVGMPPQGVMAEFEPLEFANGNRRLLGTKMGTTPIKKDIPALIALYRQGRLKLDELITGRYRLDQINQAIDSTMAGEALRNVIVF